MESGTKTIVFALFLAEISATFETAMIYAAVPKLILAFGDPITAGWLVTVHLLIGAAVSVLVGRLGDVMGRKTMMLIMLAIAAAGSVMSAATSNFGVVLAGRALQGLAVAVIPLTIGILRESLPAERVPVAVGLMTTGQGVGTAVGLVLGGAIVDYFDWHWLFVVSAILLVASWIAVKILIPARPGIPPKEPVDWMEGVLLAPGIMSLLFGISLSKGLGWSNPQVLGWVALGLLVMAYWARRSLKAREPFVDLRLFAKRNIAIANGLMVLISFGTMQIVFVFSIFIQSPKWTLAGLGLSATAAGLAKLPSNFLSLAAGPLSGFTSSRMGNRVTVFSGMLLAAVGWFASMGLPSTLVEVILLLCVISFGTTILHAALYNVIVDAVPENRTGEAVGTISVVRNIAGSIGAQIIAVMLATDALITSNGVQLPSPTGFRLTMGWIAGLTLAGAAMALLLRSRMAGKEVDKQAG